MFKNLKPAEWILIAILGTAAVFHITDARASEQEAIQRFTASAITSVIAYDILQDSEHPVLYSSSIAIALSATDEYINSPDPAQPSDERNRNLTASILGALIGSWTASSVVYTIRRHSIVIKYTKSF